VIDSAPLARVGLRRFPMPTEVVAAEFFGYAWQPVGGAILCAWQNIHGAALLPGVALALAPAATRIREIRFTHPIERG
jgi:hypothetical protein